MPLFDGQRIRDKIKELTGVVIGEKDLEYNNSSGELSITIDDSYLGIIKNISRGTIETLTPIPKMTLKEQYASTLTVEDKLNLLAKIAGVL